MEVPWCWRWQCRGFGTQGVGPGLLCTLWRSASAAQTPVPEAVPEATRPSARPPPAGAAAEAQGREEGGQGGGTAGGGEW